MIALLLAGARRALLAAAALCLVADATAQSSSEVLVSWNVGQARTSITDFVARVTTPGGPDFVPAEKRVAVFDNDGTLWSEQPVYIQFAFAIDRARTLAPRHPEWRTKQPFRGLLAGDAKAVAAMGTRGILDILAATHAGMTTDEFSTQVADWMATARHPRFDRPYLDLVYQPMIELLGHLRANGFKTFIVSGGGVDFMRPWTERVYGIPPEQVVGSSGVTRFRTGPDGRPVLLKEPKVEFVNDGPGKPSGIARFIGRRPILAFGNSDGDLQMLQWTAGGDGPFLAAIVHHTDAEREWAYDRQSHVGQLDKALDEARRRDWLIVDMKRDWKVVYAFQR